MSLDVSEFLAMIDQGGFAHRSHYDVFITNAPLIGGGTNNQNASAVDLLYRCSHVSWPGRGAESAPFSPYGPPRNFVHGQEFGVVQCDFICSADLAEKTYFLRWQDIALGKARTRSTNATGMFDLGYYDNYAKNAVLEIRQYDVDGEETFVCQCLEAFPITVSQLDGTWDSDQHHILQVTFQYYRYINDPAAFQSR